MLIPGRALPFALYIVSASLILGWTAKVWDSSGTRRPVLPLALRYSSLLVASVLVAPHLLVYDVAILAPVFLLLSDWVIAQPPASRSSSSMKIVLYLGYLAPLLGSITRSTHLQVSVVLMSILVWMIWRTSRSAATAFAA